MKRIITLLLICLFSISIFAQSDSPHLSFKGVPIDGTLNEYVNKMEAKGFDYYGTDNGTALLRGDFASYKGCTVGVSTLKKLDLVNAICVIFPECESWQALANNYYNLKDLLTEKYGKPSDVVETFQGYEPNNDGSKMTAVQLDRCKYISVFSTSKGNIQLAISHTEITKCYVTLTYFDKINSSVVRAEALDDL